MSREAAIERALTYFDDGRYIDEVAHRVAILKARIRIYDNPIEGGPGAAGLSS